MNIGSCGINKNPNFRFGRATGCLLGRGLHPLFGYLKGGWRTDKQIQNEVSKYNKNFIKENRAYGELGHPDGPTVNLERVSHMITSLEPDGKNFIGEAKIMSTPMGEIVKSLMDEGAKLGVSSRGMGSLNQKNGANYVRDDFYLATAADIVADPSAPNACPETTATF